MQSLYFLLPTALIFLFMIPVSMQVRVSYNLLQNQGVLCFFVFKIKIQYLYFEIGDKQIKIKNQNQVEQPPLQFDSPEVIFYQEFTKQIKNKTRLKFWEIYYNIGLGDAFLTSMVCGLIDVGALIFFSSIKNKKPTASLAIFDSVSYNKLSGEIASVTNVSISAFDVAYSFINSVILSRKKAAKQQMCKVL